MSSFMNDPSHPWHPKGGDGGGDSSGYVVLGLFVVIAIAALIILL